MNQITFSNKIHGKINMNIMDLIAWKAYISDEKLPPHEDKIINLHPQPACSVKDSQPYEVEPEVQKKGRGRPNKLSQVVPEIIPACSVKDRQPYEVEPEPEPIHQHPEPEPQIKRKVGRPKKALQQVLQQYA